ncbi:MAG: alpha/beta hydrolase-fold protein [Tissierellia bacterium]|nr:alpha/beta hydrolase-fold protein [Tissierellia bacterium]
MNIEQHSYYSHALGRDMTFKRYGHFGKPIIVFPSSGGSYYEYEDFGMIDAIRWYIDNGIVQVFTPDSVDNEAFLCNWKSAHDRAWMANQYDQYIVHELVGFIRHYIQYDGPFISTGCSMGAYHSLNFHLRHPDLFDTSISLSGVYDARFFVGDYDDPLVYENSPVDYIWNQNDPWFIDHYRNGNFIICTGLGRWEEITIRDTKKMDEAFRFKQIPAWIDYWGYDVDHDWPWWRQQMPYFLNALRESGKL